MAMTPEERKADLVNRLATEARGRVGETLGNRVEVTETHEAPSDAIVESTMHVEVDQETDAGEIELIRFSLERILAEVRLAVADFKAMRAQLAVLATELDHADLPMPKEEIDEAREFLKWLDDGNFVFLGYRRYGFETH